MCGFYRFCRPASARSPGFLPPFSARSGAMRFDMRTVEAKLVGDGNRCRDLLEHLAPDAACGPSVVAIVNGRWRAIGLRTIAPAAPCLQNMDDAADHTPVIDAGFARLAMWKMRLNRTPSLIRKPEKMCHLHLPGSQTQKATDLPTKSINYMGSQPSRGGGSPCCGFRSCLPWRSARLRGPGRNP